MGIFHSEWFPDEAVLFQTPLNKDGSLRQKKQRIQYIAPPPRVKKKMEEEPLVVHEALYKVTVYTGIVAGAGTDANVSVVTVIGGGQGLYSHCIYTNANVSVVAVIGGGGQGLYLSLIHIWRCRRWP